MLSNKYKNVPPSTIVVLRDERQRREIDTSDIEESVRLRGVILPLLVTPDMVLVAGERRLAAALRTNRETVPVRFVSPGLGPFELQLLELEENLIRKDLTWQEKALAMKKIYNLCEPDIGIAAFAQRIGYNRDHVSGMISMAEELLQGNAAVKEATTFNRARNIVARTEERQLANIISDLVDFTPASEPVIERARAPEDDIIQADFIQWAAEYSGAKFNFLHCDFPYGIDLQDSDQMSSGSSAASAKLYDDSQATFWNLVKALSASADRLMSSSAHVMFWFSTEDYYAILSSLEQYLPQVSFLRIPLIWHKTDNKGIASDVTRRPRHIYETALIGAVGDRKIVKLKSDIYGAPKANSDHVSEKPEPVLRYFFELFVDQHTRLLDPTCGSGSALRAAESLGAYSVTGLELDQQYLTSARSKLREFRTKRLLSQEMVP